MKTDEAVINRLFWMLRREYGSSWVMIFPNKTATDKGKAIWLLKLKCFSAENIGKTLKYVKEIYPNKPPDIDQFVSLLKHLKGSRPGYLSNHLWVSPVIKKTNNTGFREKIRAEFGV